MALPFVPSVTTRSVARLAQQILSSSYRQECVVRLCRMARPNSSSLQPVSPTEIECDENALLYRRVSCGWGS
ncbi:Uncharacterized protein APZ42_020859 [Daphnia magna]|uniref:Uncharacterized protein n=1 Tax=Daphnia magna TaxID=35525 RepID=A0A162CLD9_9CRUS|nr:Uncharacterized protein APZ42_020859 [Daphnia magna]